MSILKGQSINEKLHNREIELRQEGIREGKQEGIKEEKTNMKNTIKTLENEGKTSDEILKTLKTTFLKKISSSCPLNKMQKLKLMDSSHFKLFYEESFFKPFKVAI